jgi:predicted MPP superfamily phosphohydrolase
MRIRPLITRRRCLALAQAAVAGAAATFLYTWRVEPHWLHVVRRDLPIAGLPYGLAGKLLVQISDLHVGDVVDSSYLIRALELVSGLGQELTVITGDFMSCESSEQIEEVARVLAHLRPGPLGCVAILGNHDYGRGWLDMYAASRLCWVLESLRVAILRNESRMVGGLQIVGLDDLWGPCFAPERILGATDWDRPTLVLCHNPDACDLPIWSGYSGWILSGHTHGGQCKPPFLPPPLLPVRNTRYTAGAFDLADGRQLYINPGLGYLRRVRFNVRPEITVFRLVPDEGSNGVHGVRPVLPELTGGASTRPLNSGIATRGPVPRVSW